MACSRGYTGDDDLDSGRAGALGHPMRPAPIWPLPGWMVERPPCDGNALTAHIYRPSSTW